MHVLSVNVGVAREIRAKSGSSGIDKRPVEGRVEVGVPGPGGSGLAGDTIVDTANHGGPDQAVYAVARDDLDRWPQVLPNGSFGENLTTSGLDVTGARVGERWRIGERLELQVTCPRIPCVTFAVFRGEPGWLKAFVREARPGAYLRVVTPGDVGAGDPVVVTHRPGHDVTVGLAFRALTSEQHRLAELLAAGDDLPTELRQCAEAGEGFTIDG